jgi:hypothetical protein
MLVRRPSCPVLSPSFDPPGIHSGVAKSRTGKSQELAIYTKHGKKIVNESITVDRGCYFGRKIIKIGALVEGEAARRSLYISDLVADNGKREIWDAININAKR